MSAETLPSDDQIAAALRRAWFPVARSADLDTPQRAVLLERRLVVYRTASGRAVVAARHCPHRGADLSLGHVDGESLVCLYHGWEWDGADGRCRHIPSLDAGAGIPPRARIDVYRSEERYGLVWCCLEEPAVPLPAPAELDGLEWSHGAGEPIPQRAGIRAATENFRDVAHFPFVHRTSMGHVPHVIEPLQVRREGIDVWLDRTYQAAGGTAEEIWHSGQDWTYHAIAPAFVCLVMRTPGGGTRILLNMPSPVSATECVIYWVEGITPDFTALSLEGCLASEAEVYAEDRPILDTLDPPEAPLDPRMQVHTPADRYILQYRQAFAEFVRRAASPSQAEGEQAEQLVGEVGAGNGRGAGGVVGR